MSYFGEFGLKRTKSVEYLAYFALFIFCLFEVISGVLRYYLGSAGGAAVFYLPKIALAAYIVVKGASSLFRGRFTKNAVVLTILISVGCVVSIAIWGDVKLALFGIWTMVPFLFGFSLAPYFWKNLLRFRKYIFYLWLLAVIGVVVNYFYSWPWAGEAVEVAGYQVETTREWATAGINVARISGFSRASFDAAAQIFVFGVMVLYLVPKRWGAIVWILSLLAIVITTTKTIAAVFLLSGFLSLAVKFRVRIGWFAPMSGIFLAAFLPVYVMSSSYVLSLESNVVYFLLSSLADRFENTWPVAVESTLKMGDYMFGAGLGGAGAAQQYFNKSYYFPTDNIFIYVFCVFGFLGLIVFFKIFSRISHIDLRLVEGRVFWLLGTMIFFAGTSMNVFEAPILALALGCAVGKVPSKLRRGS